jgi:hypothetical protein
MEALPPLESHESFYARTEGMSHEEAKEEDRKWSAIKKLHKERREKEEQEKKKDKLFGSWKLQFMETMEKEKEEKNDAIAKLKSKIAVAIETLSQTHVADTAGDEFMLAKWQSDKSECLGHLNRTIHTQEEQITQMKLSFESRLSAVQSNLDSTKNNRMKKETYFNSRIKATQDRIDMALNKHKTPAIIKMEAELRQLEGKVIGT